MMKNVTNKIVMTRRKKIVTKMNMAVMKKVMIKRKM